MITVQFKVCGKPATKGSWRPITRGKKVAMVPQIERERPWSDAVGWNAKVAMKGRELLEGPVAVFITFRFLRPKKPTNAYPRGDVDKLARSCLDALNGIVWKDDNQVEHLVVTKLYDVDQGATITVAMEER